MVAREHSSGERIRRGGITKTGNGHLRRVLVEAAWAYHHRAVRSGPRSESARRLSVTRSRRSPGRRNSGCTNAITHLTARGKNKNQIVTALGRELLGFIWAIGVQWNQERDVGKRVAA